MHTSEEAVMRIAIIGAGFSGSQLAIELLRGGPSPADILLFDQSATFGPGVAFAARHDRLLLNTRVANMSALATDPTHFLRWLWAHDLPEHPAAEIPPSGHAFVARGVYGRYLSDVLDAAEAAAPHDVRLDRIGRAVVGLTDEHGFLWLKLDDGSTRAADLAVLCIGNLPPRLPHAPGVEAICGPRLIGNPWDEASIARIRPSDAVLVLGSGLTMVDVAILLADRGHRGPILALSRHGLLPTEHAPARRAPPSDGLDGLPTARGLLRQIRLEIARADRAGSGWRAVLDAWRNRVPLLWHRMPMVERRRFLRHLRPLWDIHRHRMAPEIAAQIQEMQASGQLEIRAGTIEAYQACQDGVAVRFRNRGSDTEVRVVADWLVNCAGPALDFRHVREPLIQDLLARGLVRPAPLGLGLETTRGLELVRRDGRSNGSLFALGPLTRGTFWETSAVPEIREQGRTLAKRLAMNGAARAA
jgi:uncharacterized NAD(P)/FAD-binding protein YdhS